MPMSGLPSTVFSTEQMRSSTGSITKTRLETTGSVKCTLDTLNNVQHFKYGGLKVPKLINNMT